MWLFLAGVFTGVMACLVLRSDVRHETTSNAGAGPSRGFSNSSRGRDLPSSSKYGG